MSIPELPSELDHIRQKEAEELRERMEREKRELQEFIGKASTRTQPTYQSQFLSDKDNKRMADKIQAENEERQKKEEEMKKRLKEAQEVQILGKGLYIIFLA